MDSDPQNSRSCGRGGGGGSRDPDPLASNRTTHEIRANLKFVRFG